MEVIRGLENLQEKHRGAVVVLGFFDGFHLGHQALIAEARQSAQALSAPVLLYTFDRHPLEVVNPAQAPLLLSTLEEKIELSRKYKVDFLLIGEFNAALSKFEPNDFLKQIVVEKLSPKKMIAGYNYHYGQGQLGNAKTLVRDAKTFGLSVEIVQPVEIGKTVVSSSAIRKLLEAGDVEAANRLLGHPYSLQGMVIEGKGRGKNLGIPTANLSINPRKLIPKPGVYAGAAHLAERTYGGLISIGNAPTYNDPQTTTEVYLLDFNGNLYGKSLALDFFAWRRPQEKFPSAEKLVAAMREDITWGRGILSSHLR